MILQLFAFLLQNLGYDELVDVLEVTRLCNSVIM